MLNVIEIFIKIQSLSKFLEIPVYIMSSALKSIGQAIKQNEFERAEKEIQVNYFYINFLICSYTRYSVAFSGSR